MYYKKKQFKFYLDFDGNEELCSGIVEAKDEAEARKKILEAFNCGLGILEKEDESSLTFIGSSDEEFSPKKTPVINNPYYIINEIKEEKKKEKYVDRINTIIIVTMVVLLAIINLIRLCIK